MGGGYIATCKLNQQIYYPFDIVIIQADFPPIISKRKMQLSVAIFKELKKETLWLKLRIWTVHFVVYAFQSAPDTVWQTLSGLYDSLIILCPIYGGIQNIINIQGIDAFHTKARATLL